MSVTTTTTPTDNQTNEGQSDTQDSGEDVGKTTKDDKTLAEFRMREVSQHSDSRSCWIVLYDYVYDVTEFLYEHPGGMEIILEHAGGDGTGAFHDKGHTAYARELLKQYCIGQLVESERLEDQKL